MSLRLLILCLAWTASGSAQTTIKSSIHVPFGYLRQTFPEKSFSNWIQNLVLKDRPVILDYRGRAVESGFYNVMGVVQMPLLFRSDLEQCADFAMRFWSEFHKATGGLSKLYLFNYDGQKTPFIKSGKTYREFLRWAFVNTNSHSLKSGCSAIPASDLIPGDLFVQNERGGIGHVSVVMDVCRSRKGDKLLLMGYSFMPAQEFHIEKAEDMYGKGGWFTLEGYTNYLRDNLNYGNPVFRRFEK